MFLFVVRKHYVERQTRWRSHSDYQIGRPNSDGRFSLFKADRPSSRKWKSRSFHFLTINRSSILPPCTPLATRAIRTAALRVADRRYGELLSSSISIRKLNAFPRRHVAYIARSWMPITRQRYAIIAQSRAIGKSREISRDRPKRFALALTTRDVYNVNNTYISLSFGNLERKV